MSTGTSYAPLGRFQRSVAVASATLAAAAVMSVVPADSAIAAPSVPMKPATLTRTPAPVSVVTIPAPAPVTIPPPAPVAQPSRAETTRPSRSAPRVAVQGNDSVARALAIAADQLGDPYAYGANGPSAFDCSGLTQYALTQAGIPGVARTAGGQANQARRISRADLLPGDLIFFGSGRGIYHVAFFVRWDNGRAVILHAPRPGTKVTYATAWTNNWFAGTYR